MIKLLVFAKEVDGGTGTFVKNIETFKKEDNIEVYSAILHVPLYRKSHLHNRTYFYSKEVFNYSFSVSTIVSIIRQLIWLVIKLREIKPDVLLTVDTHCLIIARFATYFYPKKIRFIATIHNNIRAVIQHKIPYAAQKTIQRLIGICLYKANTVVCVSKDLSKDVQRLFSLKHIPETIYSSIHTISSIHKRQDKNIIVSIGRFSSQKDFYTVIKAYNALEKVIHNTELWLIGDGPQKAVLKQLQKNMINNKIRIINWTNNTQKYLKKARIFVFASNWEGCPYILIEALSCGVPIVATKTPFGPSEILGSGKYGILTDMGNSEQMMQAMLHLLKNRRIYNHYNRKSYERAEFFLPTNTLDKYKVLVKS